ncbi:MAG: type II toxin-antitoxin system VapC family toxin [Candidatus Baldrarchaeota archaeon]
MSVFIDTGIFVAFFNKRDENHKRAVELLKNALSGEFGILYTSDYIFDETVTFIIKKTGRKDLAQTVGNFILGELKGYPKLFNLLYVDSEVFSYAWKLFNKYSDRRLSFTDCTSLALIKVADIPYIMSFNSDFDGIIERIY